MAQAAFEVSVIKEERRLRQGVGVGLGEEASIVRGKGDDVVEKEWLKPRELGAERCRTVFYLHTSTYVSIRLKPCELAAERCRTVLYLHTSAYVSIRQHTSACVRELGAECWLCRPDAAT